MYHMKSTDILHNKELPGGPNSPSSTYTWPWINGILRKLGMKRDVGKMPPAQLRFRQYTKFASNVSVYPPENSQEGCSCCVPENPDIISMRDKYECENNQILRRRKKSHLRNFCRHDVYEQAKWNANYAWTQQSTELVDCVRVGADIASGVDS